MDATTTPVAVTPPPTPVVPKPVQLALFLALLALVGFVAWHSVPATPRPAQEVAAAAPIRIDINRADRGELMMLPGVGPNLADRILDYRATHGPFDGFAELRKVSGIGPATLEKIRPRILIAWPESTPQRSEAGGLVVLAAKMPAKSAKATSLSEPIDVNLAGLSDLQRLPGIGPKLAQRIADVRASRPFASVDELRRVPGIGVKTLEKIRPYATVGAKSAASAHID